MAVVINEFEMVPGEAPPPPQKAGGGEGGGGGLAMLSGSALVV